MSENNKQNAEKIIKAMIQGYGPDFPFVTLVEFLESELEFDEAAINSPIPALGRYKKSVQFFADLTSGKAIGLLRFKVIVEYFIALSKELEDYSGVYKDQKIVPKLSEEDITTLRQLATIPDDVVRAETIEKFTDHDTAAAVDYIKLLVAHHMPHLANHIEGFHFSLTSEDVMGNVFGLTANKLVYKSLIPKILDYCFFLIDYCSDTDVPLTISAFTHKQAAEVTTFNKKKLPTIGAIAYLLLQLKIDGQQRFQPFSGKLGGAINDLKCLHAAYPDIDWDNFANKFVKELGLYREASSHQSSTYAVESHIFLTIANILTQIIKFTQDFVDLASCPRQFFIKEKKEGQKGSSIMPGKSNAWGQEGAIRMLKEARTFLIRLATELPDYPHEGDMGRSYLFRNIATGFMPIFIALNRIMREMKSYKPNQKKINTFFHEYPGLCGSVLQTLLKRMRISGDAYREIQKISINDDGSYANAEQFRCGLSLAIEKLGITGDDKEELLMFASDPYTAIKKPEQDSVAKIATLILLFQEFKNYQV